MSENYVVLLAEPECVKSVDLNSPNQLRKRERVLQPTDLLSWVSSDTLIRHSLMKLK